MSKVRWGVLSTAKIGTKKVIPGMQNGAYCEVAAIASRNLAKARAAASELGIAKAYGSYEALLEDPEIDAIYNPLPNHMHVPWSIKAIEAGKHVLCEKPIGLTADEGQKLLDAARKHPQLRVMEAFMYRHHPQWQKARDIVRDGGIGQPVSIQTWFSYYNDDAGDIRNQPEFGGGALMDIGCYPISLSRFIFEGEPRRVMASVTIDEQFKTDTVTSAIIDFGGITSTFTCSTKSAPYQRVHIFGTTGRVEIKIPFNAPPDEPCILYHETADEIQELKLPIADQYTIQGDLMSKAILDESPVPTPLADAVANMRVIEAIFRSGKSGKWETITKEPSE
ncbi:Gfo/Idh/MocA family oxidoreductase [Blastopirellula sp. JC732]|uniref:Gfo/Idh/MocA family oxidoreductase n=1 Tax=Blastopirellula sediminis TaxID=2894196 RepID=A0A9X1MRX3_9BACT|nr:Gfo/Idh/MocA family oxidoreductase [Blastopirellula sediminis]MCC9605380.1 Gfo/Idh/MocA family oxidoreductase [Blastopirellula sediminis]MCC9631320.1 Gfo/Idh/MocA family oxidoreductase [Blastopirellula sediminis]